jgi:ketosteroid isomerase-like protein
MSVKEIADELIALCRAGKNREAIARFYAEDILSTEPMGPSPVSRGLEAIGQKMDWFYSTMEVHSTEVNGPFINGDQFAVEFKYDVTEKPTNHRHVMHEIALYTVRDGKIAEETFLYAS